MQDYPKPSYIVVPRVNSFVEKLIGSESCSIYSNRLVDMSKSSRSAFVSVRGEFRRLEVVEVLRDGVRLRGRGPLKYDNFAGPGRFIRGSLIEPPIANIGKQCMYIDSSDKEQTGRVRSFDGNNFEISHVYKDEMDVVPKDMVRRGIFYRGDYVEHRRYGIFYHAAMFLKCDDDEDDRRRMAVLCA